MIYHSLTISGFGPYEGKNTFTFDQGLNIITGSNGSGKSSIFDAIQWVLFGPTGSFRTLKDRTSIINDSSQKATVVLEIASEDLGDIVVKRSLTRSKAHSLEFEISGEPKLTGIKNAQEAINSFLGGLQHDSFSAMSMLVSSPSNSINTFITENPSKRREILYDLADPKKLLEQRHKEVKKQITEEKPRRDKHSGEISMLESLLEDLEEIKKPKGSLEKWEERKREVVLRLNHLMTNSSSTRDILRIEDLSEKLSEIKETRDSLQEEIVVLKKDRISLKDDIEELSASFKKNSILKKRINNKIYRAKSEIEAGEMMIEALKKLSESAAKEYELSLRKMDKEKLLQEILVESGNICLVCGSHIEKNDTHVLSHDENNIDFESRQNQYDKRLRIVEKRVDELEKKAEIFKEKINSLDENEEELESLKYEHEEVEERIKEIENLLSNIPQEIKSLEKEIERLEKTSSEDDSTEEINDLKEENNILEEKIANYKNQTRDFQDYEKRRDDYNERLQEAYDNYEESQKILEKLEKEKFETSVKGIISTKISEIMEMISETATTTYKKFFNSNVSIDLVAETGENDEDTCLIIVDDRDLASYSHGEQSRIISALMVGMANAISETTGEWVPPMWDEPTISMDENYSTEFYNAIDGYVIDNEEQFLIITRDDIPNLNANIIVL